MRMSDRHGGILGLQQGVRSQINDNTFCYRKGGKKTKKSRFYLFRFCFVFREGKPLLLLFHGKRPFDLS